MEGGPILRVVEGPQRGQEYPITEQGPCIGRDAANDICVNDTNVSRQHARVLLHNGAVWVQDNGSRNGVFVNGNRVPDHKQVKTGDKITVGPSVFEVAVAASEPTPAPPPAEAAPESQSVMPLVLAGFVGLALVLCVGGSLLAVLFRP